jgi:hypothetical protein
MDFEEVEHEYVNETYLSQDRVLWRSIAEHKHGKGASCSIQADIFLISLATVAISNWTLLCVVR